MPFLSLKESSLCNALAAMSVAAASIKDIASNDTKQIVGTMMQPHI
jgi:hypothetical protein